MAISFPDPSVTDEITHNGVTYKWDPIKGSWEIVTPVTGDFVQQSYVDTLHEAHSKRIQHNSDLIEGLGKITAQSQWIVTETQQADNDYVSAVSGDMADGKSALDAKLDNRDEWINAAVPAISDIGQVGIATYDGSFDDVVAIAIHTEDLAGADQNLGGDEILMVGGEVEIYLTEGSEYNTNVNNYTIATIDSVTQTGSVFGIVLRPIHGVGILKPNLVGQTVTCVFHSGVAVATTGDLTGYLPTTGGTINGDLTITGNFGASQLGSQVTESAFILKGDVENDSDIPDGGLPHLGVGAHTNDIVLSLENPQNSAYSTFVGYYGKRTSPYSLAIQKDFEPYFKTDGSAGYPLTFTVGATNNKLDANEVALNIQSKSDSSNSSVLIKASKGNDTKFQVLPSGQVRNGTKTDDSNNRNLLDVEFYNEKKFKPGNATIATSAQDTQAGGFYYTGDVLYFKTP